MRCEIPQPFVEGLKAPDSAEKVGMHEAYVEKNLLTDERTICRMVRQNSSLGQYILDWLNSLLARLGNASAQEREFLYKARGLYANALEESHYPHKKPDKREVQAKLENLREAYNTGEITEEEFDAYRDEIDGDESLAEADMLGPFSINGNYKDASGNQYSISEIVGEKGSYGQGVVLNTNLFDGVNPRNWGKVLGKFVYENLAGKELTMYDENENAETVYLAREKDPIKKDGAKNSHKVIDMSRAGKKRFRRQGCRRRISSFGRPDGTAARTASGALRSTTAACGISPGKGMQRNDGPACPTPEARTPCSQRALWTTGWTRSGMQGIMNRLITLKEA